MTFGFPVEETKEGAANVIVPRLEAFRRNVWDYTPSRAPVFYNPLTRLSRDIAVVALQAYQRMVKRVLVVSEPLAGCGVRGIRFAKEVQGVRKVHLNDINPEAFNLMKHNVQLNDLKGVVCLANKDANLFLSLHAAPNRRFDYIDLDPSGTPVYYLDSAIRALRDGGFLALTATDLAPLCGVYPKAALRKYGGLPLRTEYCHELAIRLLIGRVVSIAAMHEIGISVLFSHSSSHYIRAYHLATYGAKKADESLRKMGYTLHCFACLHRETAPGILSAFNESCSECGSPLKSAGPLWLGNIAESGFCEQMEKETMSKGFAPRPEAVRTLSLIKAESDAPATYYVLDRLCDKLNVPIPPLTKVMERLRERGFKALGTHFHSRGIRTDAPAKTVTEVVIEAVG